MPHRNLLVPTFGTHAGDYLNSLCEKNLEMDGLPFCNLFLMSYAVAFYCLKSFSMLRDFLLGCGSGMKPHP